MEYNFNDLSPDGSIEAIHAPTRIALTTTVIVLRSNPDSHTEILLVNPNPDTWNTWMFPYTSMIIPFHGAPPKTTKELAAVLRGIRDVRSADLSLLEARISLQLGIEGVEITPASAYDNFSLKYSQSAASWTAYIFMYHLAYLLQEAGQPSIEFHWVRLDNPEIERLKSDPHLQGRSVAGNVVEILTSDWLRRLG
jgi:hypothetical protein